MHPIIAITSPPDIIRISLTRDHACHDQVFGFMKESSLLIKIFGLFLSCDAVHSGHFPSTPTVGKPWSTEDLAQKVIGFEREIV